MPSLYIKLIVAALIVSAVLGSLYAYGNKRENEGREAVRKEWAVSLIESAEAGRKAVQSALDKVKGEQEAEEKTRKEKERAEREAQQKNLAELHKLNLDLERRYLKAVTEDASCAAWSREIVRCPVQ
jgi:hypothetical protein